MRRTNWIAATCVFVTVTVALSWWLRKGGDRDENVAGESTLDVSSSAAERSTPENSQTAATPNTDASGTRVEMAPEAVSPERTSSAGKSTLIRVVDDVGEGVGGVTLFVIANDDFVRVTGVTSSNGTLSVAFAPMDQWVVVTGKGLARTETAVPRPIPEELLIRSTHGWTIRGRAIEESGRGIAGARLIAWPSTPEHARLTARRSGWAAGDHPRALTATSGADGSFEILGAERGIAYNLFAGAIGWIGDKRMADVGEQSEPVSLVLVPLYGAKLECVLEPGACDGSARASFDLETFVSLDPDAVRLPLDVAAMAGVPVFLGASQEEVGPTLLFKSRESPARESLGPFRIGVRGPGLEVTHVEFSADRTSAGLRLVEVSPRRIAPGCGRIELHIAGRGDTQGASPRELVDQVVLRGPDGSFAYAVPEAAATWTVDCLPCGQYAVEFSSCAGLTTVPLGIASVQNESTSTFAVDLASYSRLRVKVVGIDGATFRGHIPVDVARSHSRKDTRREQVHLDLWHATDSGGYLIGWLAPGEYRFFVNGPFITEDAALTDSQGWIGPIRLSAGETRPVTILMGN